MKHLSENLVDPEAGSSSAASQTVKLEQAVPKGKEKKKALTDPALASRKGPLKAGGTGDKGPAGSPPTSSSLSRNGTLV